MIGSRSKVFSPLAGDVVRDNNRFDWVANNAGQQQVVHIRVPRIRCKGQALKLMHPDSLTVPPSGGPPCHLDGTSRAEHK